MELPKNNSLRTKEIEINTKKVKLKPWTNLQLVQFEGLEIKEYKQDSILEHLIIPNIETKSTLNILEEQYILIELYKLSKSNLLDVRFACKKCNLNNKDKTKPVRSSYTFKLNEVLKYEELSDSVIKTESYIFNLSKKASYRNDLTKSTDKETIKYMSSYIKSIIYKERTILNTDIDEFTDWLFQELPNSEFSVLVDKFLKIQPKIVQKTECICEHCGTEQKLNINILDFLV